MSPSRRSSSAVLCRRSDSLSRSLAAFSMTVSPCAPAAVTAKTRAAAPAAAPRKPAPAPTTSDDARRIVVAVGGADPYVVMGDGARYFVGAALPCGGTLHSVAGQQVFVSIEGDVRPAACNGAITPTVMEGSEARLKSTEEQPVEASPSETESPPQG